MRPSPSEQKKENFSSLRLKFSQETNRKARSENRRKAEEECTYLNRRKRTIPEISFGAPWSTSSSEKNQSPWGKGKGEGKAGGSRFSFPVFRRFQSSENVKIFPSVFSLAEGEGARERGRKEGILRTDGKWVGDNRTRETTVLCSDVVLVLWLSCSNGKWRLKR
ncbi:hypothetical protein TIFTF001_020819 [Ficus carica]|uniref:Uncharacterized protein n=1 Tax=Ficus carica TaxID=3494 RepID=A0AA88AFL8_FICCA|nr:hypothetical protein TIFTF001_020819 [Ficus carica]